MRSNKLLIYLVTVVTMLICGQAQAWEGGSTGICSDEYGNNFPCSDMPTGGGDTGGGTQSGGSGGYSGPSIFDILRERRQQKIADSNDTNNLGVQYENNGDLEAAISYYEQALDIYSGNSVARDNLKNAKARRAYGLAVDYYDKGDMKNAVKYFKESLSFKRDESCQDYLKRAEARLKEEKEEKLRQDKLADAKKRVNKMLDGLSSELESESSSVKSSEVMKSLDFITEKESLYSKGTQASAPADLRFIETDKPALTRQEPQEVQKGFKTKDVPLPRVVPKWDPLSVKTTGEILIEALDAGKVDNKTGPSDLDKSILYLDSYLKTKNPDNAKVKEAVSYLEGMRERAGTQVKKKPGLFDAGNDDAAALMEAIANRRIATWPGQKNPQPGAAGPNPSDWRFQRDQVIKDAFKEGKAGLKESIAYLEKKLELDKHETDSPSRQALQYLQAYSSYDEFVEEQNKSGNKK